MLKNYVSLSRFSTLKTFLKRCFSSMPHPSDLESIMMKPVEWKTNPNTLCKQYWKFSKTNKLMGHRRKTILRIAQMNQPLNCEYSSLTEKFRWSEFRRRMIYGNLV